MESQTKLIQSKTDKAKENYNMHLILNTHWDREYRWSFCETQMRLIEAVDCLIDTMEKDSRFAYFHTDSQASFLDDYLELRPENRNRIENLVGSGRLLTGPWYTLPAEFLVSGEALVRNLLMGHKIANKLGGVMKTGYNIFSWGQVSQLPQLYRQFGMDTIMFYRGIDQSNIDKLEFWWEAPDGKKALGITFGSYHRLNFWVYVYLKYIDSSPKAVFDRTAKKGFLTNLSDTFSRDINHHIVDQYCKKDLIKALEGMDELLNTVKDKTVTSELLFLQGFDQENPDPVVPDLVDAINRKIDYGQITVSSLGNYVEQVKKSISAQKIENHLNTLSGEMLSVERSGDPFAPLYIGVFSARMPLKQMNTACEYRLERWAEPASVWAMMCGRTYPYSVLQKAWKELLQNQQHDGIGGCHVDRVTTSMIERYNNVDNISETVTRDSLNLVVKQIDMSKVQDNEIGLVVWNSSSQSRSEEVICSIDIPHEWGLRFIPGTQYKNDLGIDIYDSNANRINCQVLELNDLTVYTYLTYGSAANFQATRVKVAVQVNDVPPMGYKTLYAKPKNAVDRPVETLSPEPNVLENDYIRVEIQPDGRINITDKQNNCCYKNLHYFEDSGDIGGPLIHSKPNHNATYNNIGQPANVSMIYSGPLMAKYKVEYEWMLPKESISEMQVHVPHGREWIEHTTPKRSKEKAPLRIITEIILRKSSRMLEFETVVENIIKDHRLRVGFPTNMKSVTQCFVDSPFDIVKREITIPDSSGWYEEAARTLPSHSFIDLNDSNKGLALMHWGLPEYEVTDDCTRSIMLTLLRCFGTAGNPTETYECQPLAQCPGTHRFKYAIFCHPDNTINGRVLQKAIQYTTPIRVSQCSRNEGTLPENYSFLEIDNKDFIITALKRAENNTNDIVIRGYNPTSKTISVYIVSSINIAEAAKITLEEKKICSLDIQNSKVVSFEAAKAEIVSIKLKLNTDI